MQEGHWNLELMMMIFSVLMLNRTTIRIGSRNLLSIRLLLKLVRLLKDFWLDSRLRGIHFWRESIKINSILFLGLLIIFISILNSNLKKMGRTRLSINSVIFKVASILQGRILQIVQREKIMKVRLLIKLLRGVRGMILLIFWIKMGLDMISLLLIKSKI